MAQGDTAPQDANLLVDLATAEQRAEAVQQWPEIDTLPEPQDIWLARDAHGGELRGAAAVDLYPVPFRITGRALRLFVDDGADSAAIQSALVRPIESETRAAGLKALYAGDSAAHGSDEWQQWRSLGFEPNPKLAHYQVQLAAYLDLLTPMYDALTVRGHVPIEARIIPLAQSPIGEVIQLQIQHIGGDAGRLETRLRGKGYFPFDPDLSRVAMYNEHVCGILLAQVDRYQRLTVESKVVAPGHRRSWVNVAIMQEAAQAAARRGFDRIRFLANEQQQDTHRLARKAGPAMHRRDVMRRVVDRNPSR